MAKDWKKLYGRYKGLWVALKQDEETVIASGTSLKEAADKAKMLGHSRPILMHVPKRLTYFVGGAETRL
ncbi:DUF5678 domain-containing protein [Frankia sp. Cj3]|uniref:DUF5678 domain-containing protein n=1 Tax=Frankia sp. Cj3 TaxID=2880976 RepID=UPI001EF5CC43|nr:DUF5678 domain-containing protein [Frankia sp. Cj3]